MKYKFKINKPQVVVSKFKVYFENETGKIISITNKELTQYSNYFETPVQDIEEFLAGTKNMTKYKVIFDVREQRYKIVSDQENIVVYVDDHIFKIGQFSEAEVIVQQDIANSVWRVLASNSVKESMKQIGARLEEVMLYSVTQKNNPNILYNHFHVSIRDIIEKDYVEFEFTSHDEHDPSKVSVYTNRKFTKYCHEVIND